METLLPIITSCWYLGTLKSDEVTAPTSHPAVSLWNCSSTCYSYMEVSGSGGPFLKTYHPCSYRHTGREAGASFGGTPILNQLDPGCSLEGLIWSWISNTLATWCGELTHLKRPWCWEGLRAGAKGDDRGWDGWMSSPTQWICVWVDSRSWWWTGRPGVLKFMGSQRVGHDWATELNWTE